MLDELTNFALQVRHGVEGAAADGTLRDQPEPALDLVEPGGVCRSVVQMKARTLGEPGFDSGMFMSAVVVDDQMDIQMLRDIRFNVAQKTQELGERSIPGATPPDGLGLKLIGAAGASARNRRAAAD